MDTEFYIHIILQIIIAMVWVYVVINTIYHRRSIPLNLFGLILVAAVLMLYTVSTNLTFYGTTLETMKMTRFEWYFFDLIVALIINKSVGKCNSFDKFLSMVFKKRNNDN